MARMGAFALIFDEQGHILLCHRRDIDLWNLSGGGIERGPSSRQLLAGETWPAQ